MTTYKIISAEYTTTQNDAVILLTEDFGVVMVEALTTPDVWEEILAWGTPAPFIEPPPIPVTQVSAAQAKLALDAAGLLDDVEAMISAHPVRAVRIWFVDANVWERSHPYVSALSAEMSLDDDAIDALFAAASLY